MNKLEKLYQETQNKVIETLYNTVEWQKQYIDILQDKLDKQEELIKNLMP